MGDLRKNLGKRIQQLRKAAGLTQEKLAKRAKMDWKYLGAIERGERNVTIDNVEKIIKALGVEPYEPFLFSLKESPVAGKLGEKVLLDLVRHTDKSVHPMIVGVVQVILRWAQSKKK